MLDRPAIGAGELDAGVVGKPRPIAGLEQEHCQQIRPIRRPLPHDAFERVCAVLVGLFPVCLEYRIGRSPLVDRAPCKPSQLACHADRLAFPQGIEKDTYFFG